MLPRIVATLDEKHCKGTRQILIHKMQAEIRNLNIYGYAELTCWKKLSIKVFSTVIVVEGSS